MPRYALGETTNADQLSSSAEEPAPGKVFKGEPMLSCFPASICACASLRRSCRAICHLYDLVLAPAGLKLTQYILLYAINEAGEIAHCELADHFAASEETFSRRLASARKSGWVTVKSGDRNRKIYALTESGRERLLVATPYWERAQRRMHSELGDMNWSKLSELTEQITQAAIRAETARSKNGRVHSLAIPSPQVLRAGAGESSTPPELL
jgi:DNA-binding MarR family transcriptional regulator